MMEEGTIAIAHRRARASSGVGRPPPARFHHIDNESSDDRGGRFGRADAPDLTISRDPPPTNDSPCWNQRTRPKRRLNDCPPTTGAKHAQP